MGVSHHHHPPRGGMMMQVSEDISGVSERQVVLEGGTCITSVSHGIGKKTHISHHHCRRRCWRCCWWGCGGSTTTTTTLLLLLLLAMMDDPCMYMYVCIYVAARLYTG